MKNIKLEISARFSLACVLSTLSGVSALFDKGEMSPEEFKSTFDKDVESHFRDLEGKNLIDAANEIFQLDESNKKLFTQFAKNAAILDLLCKTPKESIQSEKITLRVLDSSGDGTSNQKMYVNNHIISFSPEYMLAVQCSSKESFDLSTEQGALEFSSLVNANFKRYVEVPNAFQQDFDQFGDFENSEMLGMCSTSLSQIIDALTSQGSLTQNILSMLDAKMLTAVKLEAN